MDKSLGLTPCTSELYIPPGAHGNEWVDPERYVKEYEHWHLVLQRAEQREKRGAAAGLIIARREVMFTTQLLPEEWADMATVLGDGPQALCDKVGMTFTGHFTGPAFNTGSLAGQTQAQVHAHLYPVVEQELPPPGARNGIGAMVEIHRANLA
jgi:diadenosine tetraphosphate (Ap4A) HIT family hydrolase